MAQTHTDRRAVVTTMHGDVNRWKGELTKAIGNIDKAYLALKAFASNSDYKAAQTNAGNDATANTFDPEFSRQKQEFDRLFADASSEASDAQMYNEAIKKIGSKRDDGESSDDIRTTVLDSLECLTDNTEQLITDIKNAVDGGETSSDVVAVVQAALTALGSHSASAITTALSAL